jgi:hypothetical protein
MNGIDTSWCIDILIVCFENPLWHFTKSLTSEWPVVRKGCTPPFYSSYVFMDIQLLWYETILFLHHQWLMWWVTQADHCICVRCYRVQFLLFRNWQLWKQWPESCGHLPHHWPQLNLWRWTMHTLRYRYWVQFPNEAVYASANYGQFVQPCWGFSFCFFFF